MAEQLQLGNMRKSIEEEDRKRVETAPSTIIPKQDVAEAIIEPAVNEANLIEEVRQVKDENGAGISDSWKNALVHFGPMLGAGLVGGLFGGTEGALAGAEKGQQIGNTLTELGQQDFDNKLALKKLDLSKQQSAQKTGIEQTKRGNFYFGSDGKQHTPLFNKNTGKFQTSDGRILKDNEVFNVAGLSLDQRERKFDNLKREQDELDRQEVATKTGFETARNLVSNIRSLKEGVNTGFIAGRANTVAQLGGISDENFDKLRASVASQKAKFMKMMSGTAVGEKEVERLAGLLPDVNDDDKVFLSKLSEFERQVKEEENIWTKNTQKWRGKLQKEMGQPVSRLESQGIDPKKQAQDMATLSQSIKTEKNPRKRLEMLKKWKKARGGK